MRAPVTKPAYTVFTAARMVVAGRRLMVRNCILGWAGSWGRGRGLGCRGRRGGVGGAGAAAVTGVEDVLAGGDGFAAADVDGRAMAVAGAGAEVVDDGEPDA